MPGNHKVEVDGVVEASHDTPEETLNHSVVLILSTAVVGGETHRDLTKSEAGCWVNAPAEQSQMHNAL